MTRQDANSAPPPRRTGAALGMEYTTGNITCRIIGSNLVELLRKGAAGARPQAREVLWGADDIVAAHRHTLRRRDKDGRDQERALRWAIDIMGLRRKQEGEP